MATAMKIGGGEVAEKESSGGFQFEEVDFEPCFVKEQEIKVSHVFENRPRQKILHQPTSPTRLRLVPPMHTRPWWRTKLCKL
jgi:hypothetical protein